MVLEIVYGLIGMTVTGIMAYYAYQTLRHLQHAPEGAMAIMLQHWRAPLAFKVMVATFGVMALGLALGSIASGPAELFMDAAAHIGILIGLLGLAGFLRNTAVITGRDEWSQ